MKVDRADPISKRLVVHSMGYKPIRTLLNQNRAKNLVHIIIDYYSKWIEAKVLASTTGVTSLQILERQYFLMIWSSKNLY